MFILLAFACSDGTGAVEIPEVVVKRDVLLIVDNDMSNMENVAELSGQVDSLPHRVGVLRFPADFDGFEWGDTRLPTIFVDPADDPAFLTLIPGFWNQVGLVEDRPTEIVIVSDRDDIHAAGPYAFGDWLLSTTDSVRIHSWSCETEALATAAEFTGGYCLNGDLSPIDN